MIIDGLNPNIRWEPLWGRYYFTATGNIDGGIQLAPGMGGTVFDLGRYAVNGDFNLGTNNPDVIVRNGTINGSLIGINANRDVFVDLTINGAGEQSGAELTGSQMAFNRVTVQNVGDGSDRAYGIRIVDGNYNIVAYSHISGIHGRHESVLVSFDGAMAIDNQFYGNELNGSGSWGWTFANWSSGINPVYSDGNYIHHVDQVFGAVGGAFSTNDNIQHVGWIGQVDVDQSTFVFDEIGQSCGDFTGTGLRDVFLGDDGSQRIEGGYGQDLLYGFGGCDTFVFSELDVGPDIITDFQSGQDTLEFNGQAYAQHGYNVGTYATQPGFYFNPYDSTLHYWDGTGAPRGVDVAYMPGAGSPPAASDFHFV